MVMIYAIKMRQMNAAKVTRIVHHFLKILNALMAFVRVHHA